ncbi:MAG TPA: DUF134 domain-containing protein [Spirochaetota bacterium]|nr:DUF134 domain-containing protein [Spirochaetota bacterium]HPI89342.1 DUF134 domain-containing protein [Spirochaetota bacterium]HPR48312.1 DUF134 domain-containing protein [Spirochaetota bacterium]
MPRPPKCRTITGFPGASRFKPAGIPARDLEEIVITIDEFEALRLADHEGLYHEDAAASMGISRQTFGNILTEARRKTAECLVMGKALRIEGAPPDVSAQNGTVFCGTCGMPLGVGMVERCPYCSSDVTVNPADCPRRKKRGCGRAKKQYRGGFNDNCDKRGK